VLGKGNDAGEILTPVISSRIWNSRVVGGKNIQCRLGEKGMQTANIFVDPSCAKS